MRIYLDICCLKRPFDDQSQPRIALETTAILSILSAVNDGRIQTVRSAAHDLENSFDPDPRRSAAVAAWLDALNPAVPAPEEVRTIFSRAREAGIGQGDALHLAWAVHLGCDELLTTDAKFMRRARKMADMIQLQVRSPIDFVQEHGL